MRNVGGARHSSSVPSTGSLGHPWTCASTCLFVRKRRGCKAGAACSYCHLCSSRAALEDRSPGEPAPHVKPAAAPDSAAAIATISADTPPPPVPRHPRLLRYRFPQAKGVKQKCHDIGEVSRGAAALPQSPLAGTAEVAEEDRQKPPPGQSASIRHSPILVSSWTTPRLESTPTASVKEATEPSFDGVFEPEGPSSPSRMTSVSSFSCATESWFSWRSEFSLGSVGHPEACAAPCKYAAKPKGCKDGPTCSRCHLCRWSRQVDISKRGTPHDTEPCYVPFTI